MLHENERLRVNAQKIKYPQVVLSTYCTEYRAIENSVLFGTNGQIIIGTLHERSKRVHEAYHTYVQDDLYK